VSQVLGTRRARIHHDLQAGEARAVVQFNERKALRVTTGADPAIDDQRFLRFGRCQNVFDECAHEDSIACCGRILRRTAERGSGTGVPPVRVVHSTHGETPVPLQIQRVYRFRRAAAHRAALRKIVAAHDASDRY